MKDEYFGSLSIIHFNELPHPKRNTDISTTTNDAIKHQTVSAFVVRIGPVVESSRKWKVGKRRGSSTRHLYLCFPPLSQTLSFLHCLCSLSIPSMVVQEEKRKKRRAMKKK